MVLAEIRITKYLDTDGEEIVATTASNALDPERGVDIYDMFAMLKFGEIEALRRTMNSAD